MNHLQAWRFKNEWRWRMPLDEPAIEVQPCVVCGTLEPCDELMAGESAHCKCFQKEYEPDCELCPKCKGEKCD